MRKLKKKCLVLLLVVLVIGLSGCGKKKYVAPPPAPYPPSNLTASTASPINLSWSDNSINENGFYVYRRTTDDYARVAIMEANATSYSDSSLSAETTYWYKVTAYNDGGESSPSNEVSVTTSADPLPGLEPPTNVAASAISYKQIDLSWQDNSDDEDSFRVACDMGVGENQFLGRVPANTTHYEHSNLQPMTQYKYYIVAERGAEDASSEQVSADTPNPIRIGYFWHDHPTKSAICGYVYSDADEMCWVELTAYFYNPDTRELIGSDSTSFYINPHSEKYVEIECTGNNSAPSWIFTVEVSDARISY